MQVALIGLGEVGRCYATQLHAAGSDLLLCEASPTPASADLASTLGLDIHPAPGPWLRRADWVLSCVTGSQAGTVARACLPYLGKQATFVDFTTASPAQKKDNAQRMHDAGHGYVDVAIMGAISLQAHRTPLLASGAPAQAFRERMESAQIPVTVLANGEAGDAISLKILRSVFTKGLEAIAVELLVAAEQQGVREQLFQNLADIEALSIRDLLESLVRTHVTHASRRADEVANAATELAGMGLPSLVLGGVEDRFRHTTRELARRPVPTPKPSCDQAIQWLSGK